MGLHRGGILMRRPNWPRLILIALAVVYLIAVIRSY